MNKSWSVEPFLPYLIFLLALLALSVQGEVQNVQFYYPSPSCRSTPFQSISQTTYNINGSILSSMSFLGMWQVWGCPNLDYTCASASTPSYHITNGSPVPYCVSGLSSGNSSFYNFKMMGDPNQCAPELHLYDAPNFTGQVIKITRRWDSADSFRIRSYWFTGDHSWSLYDRVGGGVSKCLQPNTQVQSQGYGFTFETTLGSHYPVKFVKYGCSISSSRVKTRENPFAILSIIITALLLPK